MKNTFMYIYNGGHRNLKYFYSQTMAASVVVVVHFTIFLLEQGVFCHSITSLEERFLYFLNTFLGSMSKLPFLWKNFVRIIPDKCLGLFHDIGLFECLGLFHNIGLFEYLGLFHDTRLVE